MSIVLALLLAATVPLAEDKGFAEGVRLYSQFEFEQASFRFEAAAVEQDRVPAERARVFLWLGLAYAAIGRFDDASSAFSSGLRLDPAAQLETEVSPKVQELFAAAQADVAAKVAAPPAEPTAPAPVAATDFPWLLAGGGAAVAGGAVAVAGAGVLGVLAAQSAAIAADPDQFQDDAQRAQEQGNLAIAGAVACGAIGAVLLAGGGGLVAMDLLAE